MNDTCFLAVHIGHNASAAVMKNGRIVAVGQEERFTRQKNVAGYPRHSIDFCLRAAGVAGRDVKCAAYTSVDIGHPAFIKANFNALFTIKDYLDLYGGRFYRRVFQGEGRLDYLRWLRDDERFNRHEPHFDYSFLTDDVLEDDERLFHLFQAEQRRLLASHLGISPDKVVFLDHHTCHAHYAYCASPFRERDCAVLVMDGFGDNRNQTVWRVRNDRLSLVAESNQNDIGRVYRFATLLLGMRPEEHEYKVMGLAPYAKQYYIKNSFAPLAELARIDGMRLCHGSRPQDLYSYLRTSWEGHRFDGIAGAAQQFTEQLVSKLVDNICHELGTDRLVLSGGLSLNVKMNKAVGERRGVSELFVCGSGGDDSLSIGGCYVLHEAEGGAEPLDSLCLGHDIAEDIAALDWRVLQQEYDVTHEVCYADVAALLRAGHVVARAAGRTEFGARALGHRSILADPSRRDSVMRINEAIKNRDFWMPFATSILEEHADDYVWNLKALRSPYMTLAFDTRSARYDNIQAGTHPYDRTVRPQFVSQHREPGYHALITAFHRLSGIPAVLNTSFNLHGEPIVNGTDDAFRTFRLSGIDHLLLEDVLISKRDVAAREQA